MRCLLVVCLLWLIAVAPLYAQDDAPYAIALERIDEAHDGRTRLDLNNLGLSEVPPEIEQLNNLQTLDLSGNQLTTLPPEIGLLDNLQWLFLPRNQLKTLPPDIGQLSNLQGLYLWSNQLTMLPPEIGQLSNLQFLNLGGNQLTNLPATIGNLSNLCILFLEHNNLQHLPTTIGNLNLFPQQEDDCSHYHFGHGLYVSDNPLVSPPPEVVEQGTAAMLAYLRNQAWYHMQRLIIGAATGVGLLVLLILGVRWKRQGERKSKQKRGA